MGKILKSKKNKIIAIVTACIIIVGAGIGAYFIFRCNLPKGLSYDYSTGAIVKSRIENAQYLPKTSILGINTTKNSNLSNLTLDSSTTLALNFNQDEYKTIAENLGSITGTLTTKDTNILSIKDEFLTVVESAPAFNSWFKMPNNFYYKLEFNPETALITISRLSSGQSCSVYMESENKIYNSFTQDLHQYQYIQSCYSFNSEKNEVVEYTIIDFIMFKDSFYPIQYQYLKNVESLSTTKIQTQLRTKLKALDQTYCYDLENANFGTARTITHLNYRDAYDVELLKIEQTLSNNYYSTINTTNLAYYLKQTYDTLLYTNSWNYCDSTNSVDELNLSNLFKFEEISTSSVINNLIKTTYNENPALCTNCEANSNSDLLVVKCNHNKNQDDVSLRNSNLITSSNEYQQLITDLIPWHLSNFALNLATNLNIKNDNINSYSNAICSNLQSTDTTIETSIDKYLSEFFEIFTNNSEHINKLKELYSLATTSAIELKENHLNKHEISNTIELNNLTATTVIQKTIIKVHATATIKKSKSLEKNANYSLSFVFQDQSNNIAYTVMSNYVTYKGSTLELTLSGEYNLKALTLKSKDASLNSKINLTGSFALTKQTPSGDVICSEYYNASVNNTYIDTFKTSSNGYTCSFNPRVENDNLKISVNFVDSQKPVIEIEGLQNEKITLANGSKVSDLFKILKITDNDLAQNLSFTYDGIKYSSFNDILKKGTHTISITDRTGNTTTFTFTINLL